MCQIYSLVLVRHPSSLEIMQRVRELNSWTLSDRQFSKLMGKTNIPRTLYEEGVGLEPTERSGYRPTSFQD